MTLLSEFAGLDIGFNHEDEILVYNQEQIVCDGCYRIPLNDLLHTLLNKSLRYPENPYHQYNQLMNKAHADEAWPETFRYDVIYMPAGLLGIEYGKTQTYFTPNGVVKAAAVVQVLSGTLTVIMQKNKPKLDKFDIEQRVEEGLIVNVSAGDKLMIPAGYFYFFVNSTEESVIFARLVEKEHIAPAHTFMRENGLAYFYISKNAAPQIVTNARYREVPEIKQITTNELNERLGYQAHKVSLYDEVRGHTQALRDLLLSL